jgi:hypothetical protein
VIDAAIIQGRRIGDLEIAQIQALTAANPGWSRWRLSRVLAQRWQWFAPSGQLKDMAARTLLLKLEQRGLIALPPRQRAPIGRWTRFAAQAGEAAPPSPPLDSDLGSLRPLQIQVLAPRQPEYERFGCYLAQHHYLGYGAPVGENLAYLVGSNAGVDLACLLFGAAAWQCAPRDRWIGWSAAQRARALPGVVNNCRFLVLPWVTVSHLATHVLAQIARRIQADWHGRYHHRIYLLESFVEAGRFRGTSYQAANWIRVGQTTGRTRQNWRQRDNQVHAPAKDVYLYPLSPDARRHLCR